MQRKQNGQFKKKNNNARVLLYVILLVAVFFTALYFKTAPEPVVVSEPVKINIDDIVDRKTKTAIDSKIHELENNVLETLAQCETGSLEEPDGAIVYDTAASGDIRRMSIGRYMFQRRTIIHYVKKFEGREIGKAEAIAIAIDPELSTELARKVLFGTAKGSREWYNCDKKHDLKGKIQLINELR